MPAAASGDMILSMSAMLTSAPAAAMRERSAALRMPPSSAAPAELPKSLISMLPAVAVARRCQVTEDWIDTIDAVLMAPIPTPTAKDEAATHHGPSSGRRNRYNVPPTTTARPPMRATLAGPTGMSSLPAVDDANGQPSDIVDNAKPAMIGA